MMEHFGGMESPADGWSAVDSGFAIALPRIIDIFRDPIQVLRARGKTDYHTLQTNGEVLSEICVGAATAVTCKATRSSYDREFHYETCGWSTNNLSPLNCHFS
jgi:hypothetical protein